MNSSRPSENPAAPEALDDQSVGSMLGRLLRRFDQISERQSQDGWALQALNERIDKLAERLTAAQAAAPDASAGSALDRLESRLDAIHFAIGAAPRAISSLGARLDALSTTVASKIGSASEDAAHGREEFASTLAEKIGSKMKVENRALSEALEKHGDRVDRRAQELTSRQDAAETALRDFCEQVERLAEAARQAQPKEGEAPLIDQIGLRIEDAQSAIVETAAAHARQAVVEASSETLDTLGDKLSEIFQARLEEKIAAALDKRFARLEERLDQSGGAAFDAERAAAAAREALTGPLAAQTEAVDALGAALSTRDEELSAKIEQSIATNLEKRLGEEFAQAVRQSATTAESVSEALVERVDPRLAAMAEAIDAQSAVFASKLDNLSAQSSDDVDEQALAAALDERVTPRFEALSDSLLEAVGDQTAKVQGRIDGLSDALRTPDIEAMAGSVLKSVDPRFAALMAAVEAQSAKVDGFAGAMSGLDVKAVATEVGQAVKTHLTALTTAVELQATKVSDLSKVAEDAPNAQALATAVGGHVEELLNALKAAIDAQTTGVSSKIDGLASMRSGADADTLVGALLRNVDPRFAALTAAVEAQTSKIEGLTAATSALPNPEVVTASVGEAMTPKLAAIHDAIEAHGVKVEQLKAATPDADGLAASFGEKVNPRITELSETLELQASKLDGVVAAVQESVDPSLRAMSRDLASQAEKIYGMARSSVDAALRRAVEEHLNPQRDATTELGAQVADLAKMVRGEVRSADGLRMRVDRLLNALTPAGQRMIDATQAIDDFLAKASKEADEASDGARGGEETFVAIEAAITAEIGGRLAAQAETLDRIGGHVAELKAAGEAASGGAEAAASAEDVRAAIESSLAPLGDRLDSLEAMANGGSRAADAVRARVERLLAAFGPVSQGVAAAADDIRRIAEATAPTAEQSAAPATAETVEQLMRDAVAAPLETMAGRIEEVATGAGGAATASEALRGQVEQLLAAFGPASQEMSAASDAIRGFIETAQQANAGDGSDGDADGEDAPSAEAIAASLREVAEAVMREMVAAPLETMAARLDALAKLTSGDSRSAEALRGRIDRLLSAFQPVSQEIMAATEEIRKLAANEHAGGDQHAEPVSGEAFEAALRDIVAEPIETMAVRLEEISRLSSGGATSAEMLRGRIERLLAAFHPVSQQIAEAAHRINSIAEGGVAAQVDGAPLDLTPLAQQLHAIEKRLDDVAQTAYDNSAPIGLRAVAEGLCAQRAAIDKLMSQLEAQMARGAGMAASQEQVRRRVDALFLAARQFMTRNGAEIGQSGSLTATPLDAFANDAAAGEAAGVDAILSDPAPEAFAPSAIEPVVADDRADEPVLEAEVVATPLEAMAHPMAEADIEAAPALDAATAASLRFAASFQVLYRRFADVVARFEASNSGFDIAAIKLPTEDLGEGEASDAGQFMAVAPGQNLESAAATSMRLVAGFRGLFKRFADVVERLEAAADQTPGAERSGALASPADVAVATLSEQVVEISKALLAEREALAAERSDAAENGADEFDVRLAKLEAATLEVGRHKEEFLAIAAATTRVLEQAAHGARDASAA